MRELKTSELRKKTIEELETLLKETQKELINTRLGLATKKIKNTRLLKLLRHKIAKIMTILKEVRIKEENV